MFEQIYRSRTNFIISGLCGGLGEYFNVDPKLFRWFFVIFSLCGMGLIAYIVGWIMIPQKNNISA